MAGFRYEKVEGVCLDLTESQAATLAYLLARAQEDPEFFASLTGTADARAVGLLRTTLTQMQTRISAAQRELKDHQRRRGLKSA